MLSEVVVRGTRSALDVAVLSPVSVPIADSADVVPLGGGRPVGAELLSLSRVEEERFEGLGLVEKETFLESLAFFAASWPAWRMARVRGVEIEDCGGCRGVVGLDVDVDVEARGCAEEDEGSCETEDEEGGGLEGVFAADGVGVDVASEPMCSFISPYSFHSSTSSKF